MLVRENLQEFCRTCLKSLQPTDSDSSMQYNIFVVPNLQKLMVLFTSMEVCNENDAFPKSVCQICYYKLLDFNEFRELSLRSAEVLDNLVKGIVVEEQAEQQLAEETPTSTATAAQSAKKSKTLKDADKSKCQYDNDDDDDDDNKLLLPELAGLRTVTTIKNEPMDTEEARVQSQLVFVPCGTANNAKDQDHLESVEYVKQERDIDSEYEGDSINPLYENQNYNMDEHDSIADDADDEEHALRNGAANSSSNALRSPPGTSCNTASRQRHVSSERKRDRNKKSLKCPRCNKLAYKQVYLEAHIRRDHEGHEKPFLCNECQKAFTRYNQLHVHIQSNHLLPQKFVCEFDGCNATFHLSNTLETHRQVKHPSTSDGTTFSLELQAVLEAQLNREIELEHICPQCCKKYSSKRALAEHLKRHSQIREHVCKVCGVAKVTRTELQTHMRTHDPTLEKFSCPQCPQEFNHKNAISRHIRVVHEGQRRFICSFCPRRFGTRNSQVCHERLHTGERPYSCEVCDKGFAQLEGLKSHMKNHDKNLRKHVCSYCSQRFITRKNLNDHEERHRGDKPHICNVCSRGFYKEEDLTIHRSTHTDDESEDYSGVEDTRDPAVLSTTIKIEQIDLPESD